MPPKLKTPAPIDRPLSRAYLREFSGWSTEYPPGASDPTSLRVMENVWIGREGAAKVRPGLRYLSFAALPSGDTPGVPLANRLVGGHETFFLNDGRKAYLFAVVENDGTVGFRVMVPDIVGCLVYGLAAAGIDFAIPGGEPALRFTAATTYVTYVQIDNKVFALSNAGETMRMFEVGEAKVARRLNAITRPGWDLADKLTVVHPDASWIDDTLPASIRYNYLRNPSFEESLAKWSTNSFAELTRVAAPARDGGWSLRLASQPQRVNLMTNPIRDAAAHGWTGWDVSDLNIASFAANGIFLRGTIASGTSGRYAHMISPRFDVIAGNAYTGNLQLKCGTFTALTGVRIAFYNSAGTQVGSMIDVDLLPMGGDKYLIEEFSVPAGAVKSSIRPRVQVNKAAASYIECAQVRICPAGILPDVGLYFDGGTGADYYWDGTADASTSAYHPPADIEVYTTPTSCGDGPNITVSGYFRSSGTARACSSGVKQYNASDTEVDSDYDTTTNDASGSWTRVDFTIPLHASATKASARFKVAAVPRGEYHYLDSTMLEDESAVGTYFDGSTADTGTVDNTWIGNAHDSVSKQTIVAVASSIPPPESRTTHTLLSSTAADNDINFGFFYTFSNPVGDTAPSQVTVVKAQRAWSGWLWETPNGLGEPSGVGTTDPDACADQLVAYMPEEVFDQAIAEHATRWTLYLAAWSDQDAAPVTAVKAGEKSLDSSSDYVTDGWLRITPQQVGVAQSSVPMPNMTSRINYSEPSRASQGLVAADRMVLVMDPAAPAQIRWSSNEIGAYTDFTANRGGGIKTLTSGNLYVPACVKLWQNPQSVDTLTILCMGVDGRSTGYYMAPAQVSSQSEATTLMGFEETTATPGTTSPFGCEVWNNALYHPLDDQLMKSTANNYNISHKSLTDQIARTWSRLADKQRIVSGQLDGRLYYIVRNPDGEALEPGAKGNELWVFDAKAENGTWSRWLIQACSLRTIERDGTIYMSVVRPDGIYYLDPDYSLDDYCDDGAVLTRPIPWRLETNTQGANRAHDAWAHLQQVNIVLGNFIGAMQYGIRSWDLHGQPVELIKQIRDGVDSDDPENPHDRGLAYDFEDYLLVRRDLKEWIFIAGSATDESGETLVSAGQVSLVQYRYTPSTVNTGYEFGTVESFEYLRGGNPSDARTTVNGVPMPYIDTRRP